MTTRAPVPRAPGRNEKLQAEMDGAWEMGTAGSEERKESRERPADVKLPPVECGIQRLEDTGDGRCKRPSATRLRVSPGWRVTRERSVAERQTRLTINSAIQPLQNRCDRCPSPISGAFFKESSAWDDAPAGLLGTHPPSSAAACIPAALCFLHFE